MNINTILVMSELSWVWSLIGGIAIGLIAGFFITRAIFTNQLKKNPPINEKMIRAMYMSMGRKPSEADIRRTISAINNAR